MDGQKSHLSGYQQGDVLGIPIAVLPNGVKSVKRTQRGWVLAEGEATGHAHCITDEGAALYELDGKLYLTITQPVTVTHEEHAAQTWEPGVYEIDHVREKDMLEGFIRRVVD